MPGEHCESHSVVSPVTNEITIRIALVTMLVADWVGELLDVKGAFSHGDFEDDECICMKAPEGFEKCHDPKI